MSEPTADDNSPGPVRSSDVVETVAESDAMVARGRSALGYPAVEGYEITGRLGEGGMGTVWRAVQLSTKREVALKLIGGGAAGSERARLRFEREVELTARLDHPNIARVFDGGVRRGMCFYAMELIEGVPLDAYVRRRELSRMEILGLMRQVCQAVQHAHQKGVIHRDLKPSNILVDKEGRPHVLDFGLAKALGSEDAKGLTLDGQIGGTPAYMSPEQAAGHLDKLDTRSDVYTLGVIVYHLLSGTFPHDVKGSVLEVTRRIAEQEPRSLAALRPKLDTDLSAMLGKALEREADRRYGTAGGLANDLERYLNGDAVTARPPSTTYLVRKRLRKHRKALILGGLLLALLGSVAAYVGYDYYAQWGDWIEVARYDFTRPGAKTDGLRFQNPWSLQPATAWQIGPSGMPATWSEWCMLEHVRVRGDVRVVAEVDYGKYPDGLEICLNSAAPASRTGVPPGYSAQAGGFGGRISFISRNLALTEPETSDASAAKIAAGRVAKITFERQGEQLLLQVDGDPPVRQTELLPLTGQELDRVALRSWSRTMTIRSITVYRRSLPRKASPVVAGDALVEAGDLPAALRQYSNLAEDYPHSATGEIALAKAVRLAAELPDQDEGARRALRDKFMRDYPASPLGEQVIEGDALALWHVGRHEEALAEVEKVYQINSQTRLPLRLVSSARMRMVELPGEIAGRLMSAVARVPRVDRLEINGLGVSDLTTVARPELYSLRCEFNPIRTFEPLRGSGLAGINCGMTNITSIEPLSGLPLRFLAMQECAVGDITPVKGMPIQSLDGSGCPIESLEPLRGLRTLDKLRVSRTGISSLEPLRGLSMKVLQIEHTAVKDLSPLAGAPLEEFRCSNARISSLEPLRGAPLTILSCDRNSIESLEPLRGGKLTYLECGANRIRSLAPLAGMKLRTLTVSGNPLTSLEPFVESPPDRFEFDCETLADSELERVAKIWEARPEHRRHAISARVLLAIRHRDRDGLLRLAESFGGHCYLLVPTSMTWNRAVEFAREWGGHLVTITSAEENKWITQYLRGTDVFIGLRREGGQAKWVTGEGVSFTSFLDLWSLRQDRSFIISRAEWRVTPTDAVTSPVLIEWDFDAIDEARR